jgi:hypothetical protein
MANDYFLQSREETLRVATSIPYRFLQRLSIATKMQGCDFDRGEQPLETYVNHSNTHRDPFWCWKQGE